MVLPNQLSFFGNYDCSFRIAQPCVRQYRHHPRQVIHRRLQIPHEIEHRQYIPLVRHYPDLDERHPAILAGQRRSSSFHRRHERMRALVDRRTLKTRHQKMIPAGDRPVMHPETRPAPQGLAAQAQDGF